jgi:hypothetical protein
LAIPDILSGIATLYEREEDDKLSSIDEEEDEEACSPGEQEGKSNVACLLTSVV